MTRQSVARRNRVLYDIRASPASECCKHYAAHIFIVRAYHFLRDELHSKAIPTLSQMRLTGINGRPSLTAGAVCSGIFFSFSIYTYKRIGRISCVLTNRRVQAWNWNAHAAVRW